MSKVDVRQSFSNSDESILPSSEDNIFSVKSLMFILLIYLYLINFTISTFFLILILNLII